MENQYPATCEALRSEIAEVRSHLARGLRASVIANALHARGLGNIQLLIVFLEATGASLGELKAFGQWWGEEGVTDADGFDEWADEVFGSPSRSPRIPRDDRP
jgi:hypothetical protein